MNSASIIISYRESCPDRRKNLTMVLEHLRYMEGDYEFIIVEQDEKPHAETWREVPAIKYIFLHNGDYFNKSWAYNVGALKATKNNLIFHDCDILLKTSDLAKAVEHLENYEAVSPKSIVYDVQRDAPDPFECREIKRIGSTFAGGVILFRKEAFFRIYGWDEDFAGWGKEDNAMSAKIYSFLTHLSIDGEMFHLYHEDSIGAIHKTDPQRWNNPTNILKLQQYVKKHQDRFTRNGQLLELIQEIALQGNDKLLEYYKNKPPIGGDRCPLEIL